MSNVRMIVDKMNTIVPAIVIAICVCLISYVCVDKLINDFDVINAVIGGVWMVVSISFAINYFLNLYESDKQ